MWNTVRLRIGFCALLASAIAGCGPAEPEKSWQEMNRALNALADTLERVRDVESARAVTHELDGRFGDVVQAQKNYVKNRLKHIDAEIVASRHMELAAETQRALKRWMVEGWRIEQLHGLPAEFCDVVNRRTEEFRRMALETTPERLASQTDGTRDPSGMEDADHVNLERFRLGTEKVEAERARQRAEQTEQARLRSEEHLREAEAARQQREAETARRRQEIEAARLSREAEEKKKRLDPAAPDYYDKLADRMLSTQYFEQSQAIDLLLRTDPTKVASAETRTKIARGFKQLAEQGRSDQQRQAVKGLVAWGGKFSVPIFVKMLGSSDTLVVRETIKALGELKDEQGATAVAARLGNRQYRTEAQNALRNMGSVAEDALIAVAPTEDAQVCLAAVNLLGEIGTPNSFKVLRMGVASRNPLIRQASKDAIARITMRKEAAEKEKEKRE